MELLFEELFQEEMNFDYQSEASISGVTESWIDTITDTVAHPRINTIEEIESYGNASIEINLPTWGDERIQYDPELLQRVFQEYGLGAYVGILAHEVGHSYMGVDLNESVATNWINEQNADYFAGALIAQHDLNLQEFTDFLLVECNQGSESHPDGITRWAAAQKGYYDQLNSTLFKW